MSRVCQPFVVLAVIAALLAACAPSVAPTAPPPTAASQPAATAAPKPAAPSPAATSAPAAAVQPAKEPLGLGVKASDKPVRGGTITGIQDKDGLTMDPHVTGASDINHWTLLYNTLLSLVMDEQAKTFVLKPELAESWEQKDPTTIVFNLRKGIKFHDGSEMTAEVVAWNLTRMATHPKSLVARLQAKDIKEAKVTGPNAVQVTLKAPSAPFLVNMTQGPNGAAFIISKAAVDKLGDDKFGRNPVGSGPMQFVEWKDGDRQVYKKFDGYWEMGADGKPLPYFDNYISRIVSDKNVATVELKAGNAQVMERALGKDVPGLKSNPSLNFYESPWAGSHYSVALNVNRAPFNNKKARQAAMYAIDRDAIAKVVGFGVNPPAYHWWLQGQPGYDPTLPKYSYDPAKAKQLAAEAGSPDGFSVKNLANNRSEDVMMAEAMQAQMLQAAGIKTTIDKVEQNAWTAATQNNDFDLTQTRMSLTFPDPYIYASWTATPNNYNYSNPDVDRLYDKGRTTYDVKEREATYKELQKVLFEDAGLSPVWFWQRNDVTSKKLKGWMPQPWNWNLRYAWLEP